MNVKHAPMAVLIVSLVVLGALPASAQEHTVTDVIERSHDLVLSVSRLAVTSIGLLHRAAPEVQQASIAQANNQLDAAHDDAMELLEVALTLDSDFAPAYLGQLLSTVQSLRNALDAASGGQWTEYQLWHDIAWLRLENLRLAYALWQVADHGT